MMTMFQALGKPAQGIFLMMGKQLLFSVPLWYILKGLYGFNGFIFALPAADILTAILAFVLSTPAVKNNADGGCKENALELRKTDIHGLVMF
jgi:Na+-driven multidrug efflux pump